MNERLRRLLAPLASLKLTVTLLALAMALVFAGTTIQSEMGIWDVQRLYFHSWFTMLQWRLFFPLWQWGNHNIPGAIPFPGGYTLIVLLLINLLAAHLTQLKLSWRRSGIVLVHAGLILLLVGEIITAESAVESQMTIDVGGSSNWTQDMREFELAVTDRSAADHDEEIVVPVAKLIPLNTIQHPKLPFTIQIDSCPRNSAIGGPMEKDFPGKSLATAGLGVGLKMVGVDPSSGTESGINEPSAFVTLTANDGKSLGTYLLSTITLGPPFPAIDQPQTIDVGGKAYWIQLRFRRYYRDYAIHLVKFSHDRYTGTDIPRNFSSLVRIVDPAHNVDREVLIWMNHPLRYAGETFYQASFKRDDQTSILDVVHNPGWLIPYISCSMVGLGMLVHFGVYLLPFLASQVAPADGGAGQREPKRRSGSKSSKSPKSEIRNKSSWVPAVVITGVCAIYLLMLGWTPPASDGIDLNQFACVPVSYEGRTMPLDSLARNSLRILSGKSQLQTDQGVKSAIAWLLDVFADPDKGDNYKVFRIDHPDILSLLGLDDSRKLFSYGEIAKNITKLQEQYQLASDVPDRKRDLYQRKIIELAGHFMLFNELAGRETLYLSPPLVAPDWRSLAAATSAAEKTGPRDPGAEAFMGMIQAANANQTLDFNAIASEYRKLLELKLPDVARKLDIEVIFNRTEPFIQCMALYVIVFILAAGSWLWWHRPLARAALWVLVLSLVFHTLGLITRVYLQGRPPATNLYSSAIFIAWAAVGFCVVLELIFRNGVASAAAASLAFPSLLIAHYLAGSGDTMQMLQAVLDTNIWLATHVVVITLGYAATFLAGFLAIAYVIGGVFTPALNADVRKNFMRMVYGVVCFAMIASFVGTILGGIWADQSWGRFWGWDPKENGAVLIVLWNAIILHARSGSIVRERGFMLLAIAGNIITSWSWFGTNMLGVGLHSYGFMDSALFWLLAWVALQIAIIGLGSIPLRLWRSSGNAQNLALPSVG